MKNTDKLNQNIFVKDNLEVLRAFDSESVDLIYLDPPFNSNKNYSAPIGSKVAGEHFKDIWTDSDADKDLGGLLAQKEPAIYEIIHAVGCINGESSKNYLIEMAMRLLEMKRVLKDTGSIYLHCDQTMSHSLKLVMDAIFGKKNFRNEIIWHFPSMSRAKNHFPKKHNLIFWYTKTESFVFNSDKIRIPYAPTTRARAKYGGAGFKGKEGEANYLNPSGKIPDTVWTVPHVKGKESTGYSTQKPRPVLERIIKASSNEGDLVLDPFCGCATTCIAAEKLNRRWIGIDWSKKAGSLVKQRLKNELNASFSLLKKIQVRETLPIKDAPKPSKDIKQTLYGQQGGDCNGCNEHFKIWMFHLDHVIAKSKGGQDTDTNLQLLCGNCNSIKGDRGMEYLIAKLKDQGINKFKIVKSED